MQICWINCEKKFFMISKYRMVIKEIKGVIQRGSFSAWMGILTAFLSVLQTIDMITHTPLWASLQDRETESPLKYLPVIFNKESLLDQTVV